MGGEKEGDWKSSAGSRQAGRDLGVCHRSMTWMTSSCLEVAQVHPAAWAGLVCKWPRELCQEGSRHFPLPRTFIGRQASLNRERNKFPASTFEQGHLTFTG